MSSVNVDGFELSTVIIDEDGNQYNDMYEWNATDYFQSQTIIYQVNYKKTNAATSYEPGELVIEVDNLYYYSPSNIEISGDMCSNEEKTGTWSYSSRRNSCYTYVSSPSDNEHHIVFTNNNAVEPNTNFEGSIRIISYLGFFYKKHR
jgi:hypothetical protein